MIKPLKELAGTLCIDFTINAEGEVKSSIGSSYKDRSVRNAIVMEDLMLDKIHYNVVKSAMESLVKDREDRKDVFNLSMKDSASKILEKLKDGYSYEAFKTSSDTTRIICGAANIDQEFLDEDVPKLIRDLPSLINAQREYEK